MEHRTQRFHYRKAAAALASWSILVFAGLTGALFPLVAVATPIDLGTADSFSVLGGGAATNTGPSSGADADASGDSDAGGSQATENDDSYESSNSGDFVPKGHPRTGIGGTASEFYANPRTIVPVIVGGLAGSWVMLFLASGLRRRSRRDL